MYGQQGVNEGVADMHSNELLNTVRGAIRKAIKETGDQSLSKIFVCLRDARPASEALKNITSPNSLAEVDNALQEVGIDFDDLLDFINKQAEKYGRQGMAEGMEDSSIASALTGHIMRQRLDLLKMYGPVKVMAAIDDAAEHYGNPDEIGSSDMYAYVQYVENALSGMTEGLAEGFGSYYSEQLAEKVFAQMPNLQNQDDIISAGYDMAKQEPNLGASVDGIFRDRDFVSDFVTNYGYLQKQGMAEDLDTDGVMMTRPSNMSSESATLDLERLKRLALM
jgi:hypothetical protein